jgi:dUTP pyrophosphatase
MLKVFKLPHCPSNQLSKSSPTDCGYDICVAEDCIIPSFKDVKFEYEYIKIISLENKELLPQLESLGLVGKDYIKRKKYKLNLVKTGIIIKNEEPCWYGIYPRSSTSSKLGVSLINNVGVIDYSYCGPNDEILLPLISLYDSPIFILKGERVAQLIIHSLHNPLVQVVEDWDIKENRGGFGSTN